MADAFEIAGKRVLVAGHRGMVGSALVRRLAHEGCTVLTAEHTLDLRNQAAVHGWMDANRPDAVVIAAAKVGGILANDSYPADFLYDNLMIAANLIEAAHRADVDRLLFLGSSCIYPRLAPQPMAEDALLTGPLEPTNEGYAIAKIAGIKLVQAYRRQHGRRYVSAMPTNLYGPGDSYHPERSHVLPALIRKAHEAKEAGAGEFAVWGSGTPRREFLHVDDLADALVMLLRRYDEADPINVGTGTDITIADLAGLVSEVVGFEGAIAFDASKPDGAPRKLLDCTRIAALGWRARIGLREGIADAYRDFLAGGGRR